MSTHEHSVPGQPALEPGDHVRVQDQSGFQYRAVVEDSLSALHVVWVREVGTGDRKMVSTDEHTLLRH